jgi:ATP-binding cassette subfamily B protein
MTAGLVRARALQRGAEAARVVARFFADQSLDVPGQYWSVVRAAHGELIQRGVVLTVMTRMTEEHAPTRAAERGAAPARQAAEPAVAPQSLRQVLELLRADGLITPTVLTAALVLATVGLMVQALLFQGVLDLTATLQDAGQRVALLGGILIFMLLLLSVEIPINALLLQMGRKLEIRFRLRFLEKIPRLGERFFQGHLKSDLVQRAHSLRQLHLIPELGVTLFRLGLQLLLTTLGILWLDPPAALFAALATLVFMALAFFTQPVLQERDLRLRTQMGALSRFYLDAMLGLVPLKMHGAQRAFRREYEGLVHDWAGANWDLAQLANRLQALSVFVYAIIAVRLVLDFLARNGTTAGTLLFFFWILSLPVLATALVQAIQQYPMLRSLTLRVLEPLNAPDENPLAPGAVAPAPEEARDAGQAATGVAVSMDNVMVRLGGNVVLHNINLQIRPGEHVAIVGPSGAGKTTLVGLLLGWHAPSGGECRADGARVEGAQLQLLRRATVWVDPAIQLWNRTLWENVLYGNAPHALAAPARAIEEADLLPVVEQLDAGAETTLGESGGLVSGGEGQRVRLARGMARAGTRLVILDEPFRGLDRETRRKLLARARAFWKDVTLLCVTHDVNETRAFERVLVVEEGRIVEDAPPAQLEEKRDSRYRALLEGEQAVRTGLWAGPEWRRLWIQDGALQE